MEAPTLRELVRVIPVAKSETRGMVQVTVISLDAYADGSLLRLRVRLEGDKRFPDQGPLGPQLPLRVTDNLDTNYAIRPSRSAWRSESKLEYSLEYIVLPALTEAARSLTLEIPEIQFLRFRPEQRIFVSRDIAEAWPGPWIFDITLD